MSAFSLPPPFDPVCDAHRAASQLLCRARNGDPNAFAHLCEMHRKRVWNVVASITRNADTDDLAQDALVRAWVALPGYRGEAPAFGAWLCRIALNAAHDYQKSAWRRRVLVGISGGGGNAIEGNSGEPGVTASPFSFAAPAAPGPHEEALRRETVRRVRGAVLALAPKERVPIWLVYFEEFSLIEVARMENVPESTIRSRVKKGLSRLQKTLGDLNVAEAVVSVSSAPTADAWCGEAAPLVGSPPSADWKGCVRA